ncbi:FecR domain-containing protein [Pedobacter sp. PLR]|uniref:FecR family protein n=1 Tax=Pedobacter sp. PLR TaxID=2994465 RepID=UPI002247E96A|nr:FecR family protein [Pedobacter sp. PLR]MCX2451878.1 FecR domain-containing protein [Pedobacter sp. PLR]
MAKLDAKELLIKYLSGECTEEEQALLAQWHLNSTADREDQMVGFDLTEQERRNDLDEVWSRLQLDEEKALFKEERPRRLLWPSIAAAASIAIALTAGILFYTSKSAKEDKGLLTQRQTQQQHLPAGGNNAVLTLDDGTQISLSDAKKGTLVTESGISISKTKEGQLVYHLSNINKPNTYNTISTPNGGQYQVVLPDGTKVWLNAASSLRFPLTFDHLSERKVELKGEAYFEVAKQLKNKKGERVPFIVLTEKQEVEVLGTHFNINAYKDEPAVKTTLMEGSVKVAGQKNTLVLKPGEQATGGHDRLSLSKVDTEDVISWKTGYFRFNDTDLKTIMRQASRWYDVDVVYAGEIPPILFSGEVSRKVDAMAFLEMLRYLNIKFKIEKQTNTRNRIVVSL